MLNFRAHLFDNSTKNSFIAHVLRANKRKNANVLFDKHTIIKS